MSDFVDDSKLEAQFAEAMAEPEGSGLLIFTGLDLVMGEASTDVFKVNGVATPTESKTVLLVTQTGSGDEYKITFENLSVKQEENNG